MDPDAWLLEAVNADPHGYTRCVRIVASPQSGGGRCVLTTQRVRAGEPLLAERPTLACPEPRPGESMHVAFARAVLSLAHVCDAGPSPEAADPAVRRLLSALHPRTAADARCVLGACAAAARAALERDVDALERELSSAGVRFERVYVLQTLLQMRMNAFRSGLYGALSMINHSCAPSATKLDPAADARGRSRVHALRDLAEGEEVTICYLPSPLVCEPAARACLVEQHHFRPADHPHAASARALELASAEGEGEGCSPTPQSAAAREAAASVKRTLMQLERELEDAAAELDDLTRAPTAASERSARAWRALGNRLSALAGAAGATGTAAGAEGAAGAAQGAGMAGWAEREARGEDTNGRTCLPGAAALAAAPAASVERGTVTPADPDGPRRSLATQPGLERAAWEALGGWLTAARAQLLHARALSEGLRAGAFGSAGAERVESACALLGACLSLNRAYARLLGAHPRSGAGAGACVLLLPPPKRAAGEAAAPSRLLSAHCLGGHYEELAHAIGDLLAHAPRRLCAQFGACWASPGQAAREHAELLRAAEAVHALYSADEPGGGGTARGSAQGVPPRSGGMASARAPSAPDSGGARATAHAWLAHKAPAGAASERAAFGVGAAAPAGPAAARPGSTGCAGGGPVGAPPSLGDAGVCPAAGFPSSSAGPAVWPGGTGRDAAPSDGAPLRTGAALPADDTAWDVFA